MRYLKEYKGGRMSGLGQIVRHVQQYLSIAGQIVQQSILSFHIHCYANTLWLQPRKLYLASPGAL